MLRNRSFVLLMAGEIVFGMGIWLSIMANLHFMQDLVPSDFLKALILMAGLLMSVLIAPYAGVLCDKHDKRAVMIAASLLRCLSPLTMFPALAYDSVAWMVLSVVLMQTSNSIYQPASQAALPGIVPPDRLLAANSVWLNINTATRIAGTALGGVMILYVDLYTFYLGSLIFFALVTLCLFGVRIPRTEAAGQSREKVRFREVFPHIVERPAVLICLVNMGMVMLFLGGFNLLVLNFSEYQQDPQLMGWIYAVEGTSILLGGLAAKRFIGSRNLVTSSIWLMFGFAASFFGMSYAGSSLVVLVSFALFGLTVAFFFPMNTTITQKQLPGDVQGRFFSFKNMLDRILFQVALLATGASLDLIGISGYMMSLAALTALVGAVTLVYGKRLHLDVRQKEPTPARTA